MISWDKVIVNVKNITPIGRKAKSIASLAQGDSFLPMGTLMHQKCNI